MDESTRLHYRGEILRVLREEGTMHVSTLPFSVKPHIGCKAVRATDEIVRQVRREMEAEGLLRVWRDRSQRNHPFVVGEVLTGPRRIRGVRLVVDAVGLPTGAVTVDVRCQPVSVARLPALVAQAVQQLGAEYRVALNLGGAAVLPNSVR